MKRVCIILLMIFTMIFIWDKVIFGKIFSEDENAAMQQEVSSKLIRFHVLANSDSENDQKLKLKVKNEVLKLISPEMSKCTNIEQSRETLKKYTPQIEQLSEKIIKQNGYNYKVRTELSNENFPIKSYGNITLPQGNYEAYRILIGNAEGKNWWCVMFPPLCFIDVTKGEISDKATSEKIRSVLNEEQFQYVTGNTENNIQFKFKIISWLTNKN